MKKSLLFLSIISLFAVGFANEETLSNEKKDLVSMHSMKNSNSRYYLDGKKDRNDQEENTATEKHTLSHCCLAQEGFFFSPEFLFWSTKNSGWYYAQNTVSGKISRNKAEMKPGFRLTAGYTVPHDLWQVYATWTYHNQSNSNKTVVSDNTLKALFGAADHLNYTYGKWSLNYNVIDALLAKSFYASNFLSLTPNFGPTIAWLYQNYHATYDQSTSEAVALPYNFSAHGDFWGFGLRAGLNTNWHVHKYISLFGNCSFAGLFGKNKFSQTSVYGSTTERSNYYNYEIKPHLQFQLGLAYTQCYDGTLKLFSCRVGMEINHWMDQFPLMIIPVNANTTGGGYSISNKSLDSIGLNLAFRFEF